MKFQNVYCSQCGQGFGPGDSGFSHCRDHSAPSFDFVFEVQYLNGASNRRTPESIRWRWGGRRGDALTCLEDEP